MMSRAVSLLALIVLAVGLLAGAAGPARAMAHHHHAPPAAQAEEPCVSAELSVAGCDSGHHGGPTHRHGAAGCLCVVGACDLSALPLRVAGAAYGIMDVLRPPADRSPPAVAHAPPLKPPRA